MASIHHPTIESESESGDEADLLSKWAPRLTPEQRERLHEITRQCEDLHAASVACGKASNAIFAEALNAHVGELSQEWSIETDDPPTPPMPSPTVSEHAVVAATTTGSRAYSPVADKENVAPPHRTSFSNALPNWKRLVDLEVAKYHDKNSCNVEDPEELD